MNRPHKNKLSEHTVITKHQEMKQERTITKHQSNIDKPSEHQDPQVKSEQQEEQYRGINSYREQHGEENIQQDRKIKSRHIPKKIKDDQESEGNLMQQQLRQHLAKNEQNKKAFQKKQEEIQNVEKDEEKDNQSFGFYKRKRTNKEQERKKAQIIVDSLLYELNHSYREDINAIQRKKNAYRRIKFLNGLEKSLRNVEIKKVFLEKNGLDELMAYLMPILDKQKDEYIEPCVGVKMKLFEVVYNLNMKPDEIQKYGAQIYQQISKNRHRSKIPEVRQLCILVLKNWDYIMFRDLGIRSQ